MGPAERPAPYLEFEHATRAQDRAIVLGNGRICWRRMVMKRGFFRRVRKRCLRGRSLISDEGSLVPLDQVSLHKCLRFHMIHGLSTPGKLFLLATAFLFSRLCRNESGCPLEEAWRPKLGKDLCGESSRSLVEMTEIPRHQRTEDVRQIISGSKLKCIRYDW
ncbi:hypothetical protein BDZ45DRAFT_270054 [Acephala macrosclerotiorum]|nr:hypothetical protein BDZ45DRAFT_270054 [Acephala macrosclerotiorum]